MQSAQRLTLTPKLESLTICSDSPGAHAWSTSFNTIQLQHLSKLSITGCDDFGIAWLKILKLPTLVQLHIEIFSLEFPEHLLDVIDDHCNLQELHVKLGGWGDGYTIGDILHSLQNFPNLTTLRFLGDPPDGGDAPEYLDYDDAVTISEYWPKLRVLDVALADMDFFLDVVDLPHLEELTVNAWFWESGFEDPSNVPCPNLRVLRFSGCPPHWATDGPNEIKMHRFPNLTSFEMIPGDGGAERDPAWC